MKQRDNHRATETPRGTRSGILCLLLCLIVFPAGAFAAAGENLLLSALVKEDAQGRTLSVAERESLNSEETLNALIGLIRGSKHDWKLQIRGIRVLGQTGNRVAAETLREMFYDPVFNWGCPALKTSLATALGNFPGNKRVTEALIEGANDEEIQVREASIRSLGKTGDRSAVPLLLEKLRDRNFVIRLSAIWSLGEVRDERALEPLRQAAENDQDVLIRNAALSALSRIE